MKNYIQPGNTLDLSPGAAVTSGNGYLFGTSLFGVATMDVANGATGAFLVEGVVDIAKDTALAINVGDKVYWDSANNWVDKTATAQQNVGVAIESVGSSVATVKIKLGSVTAAGA